MIWLRSCIASLRQNHDHDANKLTLLRRYEYNLTALMRLTFAAIVHSFAYCEKMDTNRTIKIEYIPKPMGI